MLVNPLAKKLQLKLGQRVLLINAPNAYINLLEPLPDNITISTALHGKYDHVQLFVTNTIDLIRLLGAVNTLLTPSTVIWIVYPKKASGIVSDIERMSSLSLIGKYGLRPVASAAIDGVWTAIRLKPSDQVRKSASGKAEIQNNKFGEFIDVENRIIKIPPDLQEELEQQPSTLTFFESLSWTNKKEYVTWILTAKQEKTRASRISKAAEMLIQQKKNPTAK